MSNVTNLEATTVRNVGKNTFIPKPFEHIYTCNNGDLIPAFATIQVQPGDTWKITTSIMARLNTSRYPTISRGWIVYNWFYVPHSQIWDNWDALMGENKDSAWVTQAAVSVPKINIPEGTTIQNGSLLDHFGWPTGQGNFKASALKVRAYSWICNEFYRNQNIEAPYAPDTGEAEITYTENGDWTVGGKPNQILRNADYFSTALPEPQKGPDVLLPLGTSATVKLKNPSAPGTMLVRRSSDGTLSNTYSPTSEYSDGLIVPGGNYQPSGVLANETADNTYTAVAIDPNGRLITDLENAISGNLTDLRQAAITQRIYEKDARAGTRAAEMLWARYGVEIDPLELGRPVLLTGGKFDISTNQVPQTAPTENAPTGTLTAFGYTNNRSDQDTFSFKQHGTLMCLVAVAYEHKYQQGIPREDMKFDRFDFWHPEFAGLGDQPIYNYEIYATGGANGTIATESIFGYAVRGAEYQNYPSIVSGQVRSNYAQSMDYVHMADEYSSVPTLSTEWMKENPNNLDRTIYVSSDITNQFVVDFVAEFEITTCMPLYSIPGIDRL